MKRKIGISVSILALVLIVLLIIFLKSDFYATDDELNSKLKFHNSICQFHYVQNAFGKQRFLICEKEKDLPYVVMIHGAPGSLGDFVVYLQREDLRDQFNLLALDRPGYSISSNKADYFTIKDQALSTIDILIEAGIKSNDIYFLSHSYGGPVAAKASVILGEQVKGHIMVAPVIDPYSEKVHWYSKVPIIWPFKIIASGSWKQASIEKVNHIEDLKRLEPVWQQSTSRTFHIHGTQDWLAPIENVCFAQKAFSSELYQSEVLKDGSHFILWDEEVIDRIIDQLMDWKSELIVEISR